MDGPEGDRTPCHFENLTIVKKRDNLETDDRPIVNHSVQKIRQRNGSHGTAEMASVAEIVRIIVVTNSKIIMAVYFLLTRKTTIARLRAALKQCHSGGEGEYREKITSQALSEKRLEFLTRHLRVTSSF